MNFSRPSPSIANNNEFHYLRNVKMWEDSRQHSGKRFVRKKTEAILAELDTDYSKRN
jgi:hypothetical protein